MLYTLWVLTLEIEGLVCEMMLTLHFVGFVIQPKSCLTRENNVGVLVIRIELHSLRVISHCGDRDSEII